ncbi:sensor histidine kinase [Gehongia tenuis]|uniref:histidine kinase n=1 Tax=Gehongia tenuis TaxID=2763655 RepID=A0A926D401_9FIRM|nr:ATP-binding protein [Gehongia tenuis]MBC8530831.1 HAMP domain-containing protein [Gehongia tenuis]
MIHSVFFRRILWLVVITLMLSGLMTTMLFMSFTRSLLINTKAYDLVPQTRELAWLCGQDTQRSDDVLNYLLNDSAFLDASVVILDEKGNVLSAPESVAGIGDIETFTANMSGEISRVLAGEELRYVDYVRYNKLSNLMIGTPVTGRDGSPAGAVFLFKPITEIITAFSGLNMAFITSALIVLVIMAGAAFFVSRRIIRPLYRMRDIALAMADGNFSVRADESQSGEIGQLGNSLNVLARELDATIRALKLEKQRLQSILDSLSEGMIAVDIKGSITHINPAAHALLGRSPDTPAEPMDLVDDKRFWEDFYSVLVDCHSASRNLALPEATLLATFSPILDDLGNAEGAVALIRDVSAAKRMERLQQEYVANVSHELRSPLTAIRGLAEPLREGMVTDPGDQLRYINIIYQETLRLSRLVDDLMELSRLQSGAFAESSRAFDLAELLEDVKDRMAPIAQDRDIAFDLSVPEEMEVMSNPDRIEQVLVILLDNALKFTPAGGRVTVSAKERTASYQIHVEDTGPGIDATALPYLFQRFYKADKARGRGRSVGSGLGLSIAKQVMDNLGEEISVKSQKGHGADFFFTVKKV